MKEIKHCLVTGSSGFVGRHLCAELKRRDIHVRALFRTPCEGPWDESQIFDLNDCHEKDFPKTLIENVDTVFHLAGIAHAFASVEEYQTINVLATQKLLELIKNSQVKRFIYFSSVKAIEPFDNYGRSKQASEKLVLEFGKKNNIHVAILRPALVYGVGVKGNFISMLHAIQKGRFLPIPEIGNRRSMISVNDLIQAAMLVATEEKANGKIYTVTDGVPYSSRQLYDGMRRALDLPPRKWAIPHKLLRFILCRLLNKPMLYNRLLSSMYFSNEEIQRELGWSPKEDVYRVLPSIVQSITNSIR